MGKAQGPGLKTWDLPPGCDCGIPPGSIIWAVKTRTVQQGWRSGPPGHASPDQRQTGLSQNSQERPVAPLTSEIITRSGLETIQTPPARRCGYF